MTLRQKAYLAIRKKITHFELKPGQKILESNIARVLKIGRVPVREALTMLESERLIVKTKGYGYAVTRINSKEITDYYTIRTQLECLGAALFLQRATPTDIRRLRKHLDRARVIYQGDNVRKIIESDTLFHELTYRATRSGIFYQTMASLADKTIILRAAALQTPEGRQASLKDHLKIMQAIEEKNLPKLNELIVEHMRYAPRYYETIPSVIAD